MSSRRSFLKALPFAVGLPALFVAGDKSVRGVAGCFSGDGKTWTVQVDAPGGPHGRQRVTFHDCKLESVDDLRWQLADYKEIEVTYT